jgi:hypothetical protein
MSPLVRRTPLVRRPPLVVPRPGWLTGGIIRLAVLCGFVVAVGMVRPRLSTERAWVVIGVFGAAVLVGGALFLVATRRLTRSGVFEQATLAVLHLIRRTGLPLLGLAFFIVWTLVYMALWAVHPEEAFRGLDAKPRFADFFYYSVSTAVISPPGDIIAHSRGARSATMIEMLTALALLTAYLSSFVDWQRAQPEQQPAEPPRAS